jgi:hypothetical protein
MSSDLSQVVMVLMYAVCLYFIFLLLLLYLLLYFVKKKTIFKIEKKSGYNKHHKSIILFHLSPHFFFVFSTVWCPGNCALVTNPHMYINEFNRFFYLFFTTRFFSYSLSFSFVHFPPPSSAFILILFSSFSLSIFYILFCVATGVQ